MNATPLVSVLIPCFNARRWIGEAIESALAQTYAPKEIVVVDDGSTDGSLDAIRRYEGRIRWETGPNRGGGAARNRLLALARGEWLQYLDADDYIAPAKITDQVAALAECRDADILFGPEAIEYVTAETREREARPIPEPRDTAILFARRCLPTTGAPLWRKQAILDVGGWREDQPCCQEYELYLRLLMGGRQFAYCEAGGAIHREWSAATVSRRDWAEMHRQCLALADRLESWLRDRDEASAERLAALAQGRFEVARAMWLYAPVRAREIMARVRTARPDFRPDGAMARPAYRLAFRLLGFHGAESVARFARTGRAIMPLGMKPGARTHIRSGLRKIIKSKLQLDNTSLDERLAFCPSLREMSRQRRKVGKTGKKFDDLSALSTRLNLVLLRELMMEMNPKRTIEVGLCFGGSALVFTSSHRDLGSPPKRQHVALDPFQATVWDSVGLMEIERAGLCDYMDFRPSYSCTELPNFLRSGDKFDLIYVDGSHLVEDVFVDAYYAIRLLPKDGIVVFDDCRDSHVAKVINFLRTNCCDSLEEVDLSKYLRNQASKSLYRAARRIGRIQMLAFRRIGNANRSWDASFRPF